MILNEKKYNQFYFEKICSIPHITYHEKALSDYIVSIAKENNLEYFQDEMNNVLVKVKASNGYENHETVLLSGHMDMVANKSADSDFDFIHDPIELIKEEHILHANKTTLGGDDGIATSTMLGFMNEKFRHPALELLFTVQEESDCGGAHYFDVSRLKAKRMIGLDTVGENKVTVGNYASDLVHINLTYPKVKEKISAYKVHFGDIEPYYVEDTINTYDKNAVQYFVSEISKHDCTFRLVSIDGGRAENYPLQNCDVVIDVDEEILKGIPLCTYSKVEALDYFNYEDSKNIFHTILDVKSGAYRYEETMLSSFFFGKIETIKDNIRIIGSTRCLNTELNDEVIHILKKEVSDNVELSVRYRGWPVSTKHELKDKYNKLSQKYFNKAIEEVICPGGLEIAIFLNKIPDLEVLSAGPLAGDFHTPHEWLDLDSFDRFYELMKDLLSEL